MLRAKFSTNGLTSSARHAKLSDMKTTRARRLPTGDRLTVPRLVSPQQAAAPVDKSAGGGCSYSLIWQRLNLSRAGGCDRGVGVVIDEIEGANAFYIEINVFGVDSEFGSE